MDAVKSDVLPADPDREARFALVRPLSEVRALRARRRVLAIGVAFEGHALGREDFGEADHSGAP